MKLDWTSLLIFSLFQSAILLLAGAVMVAFFSKPIIKWVSGRIIKRIQSEKYKENMWEMVPAIARVGAITSVENHMRANSGKIIKRPFGSPRKFVNFDGLVFSPAQLHRLPTAINLPVNMSTIIGPNAKKPLRLALPILAGGMGYGVAVSGKVKRAVAKATAATGTATNSGQGAFLPEERGLAKYLILQYTTGAWTRHPEILRQADAIEIYIGQGAAAGSKKEIPPEDLRGELRETFGLAGNETLMIPPRFEELTDSEGLKKMVHHLRSITDGIRLV